MHVSMLLSYPLLPLPPSSLPKQRDILVGKSVQKKTQNLEQWSLLEVGRGTNNEIHVGKDT